MDPKITSDPDSYLAPDPKLLRKQLSARIRAEFTLQLISVKLAC
jgi:hypothetical protein